MNLTITFKYLYYDIMTNEIVFIKCFRVSQSDGQRLVGLMCSL